MFVEIIPNLMIVGAGVRQRKIQNWERRITAAVCITFRLDADESTLKGIERECVGRVQTPTPPQVQKILKSVRYFIYFSGVLHDNIFILRSRQAAARRDTQKSPTMCEQFFSALCLSPAS